MIRKVLQGMIIGALVVLVPVMGNPGVLGALHLWIIILLGILASVLQPAYHPITIATIKQDRGTGAQILWSVYLTQLAAVLEATYLRFPQSLAWDLTATLAVGAIGLGLVLRTWAVRTLGRLFTMHIDIQKDHVLVCEGPFRFVRHPSYLGALITYLATTVLLHAWFSLLIAAILLPLAFMRRIRYEEEALVATFGEPYEAYRLRVKRMLPWIW
jgi:protein-S-isoprenylcysteine O-methyltransferase Ste14